MLQFLHNHAEGFTNKVDITVRYTENKYTAYRVIQEKNGRYFERGFKIIHRHFSWITRATVKAVKHNNYLLKYHFSTTPFRLRDRYQVEQESNVFSFFFKQTMTSYVTEIILEQIIFVLG